MKESGVAAEVIAVSAGRARNTNLRTAPATTHPDYIGEIPRLGPADRATARKQPLHLQELTFKFELPLSRVFVSCTPGADAHDCGADGPEVNISRQISGSESTPSARRE